MKKTNILLTERLREDPQMPPSSYVRQVVKQWLEKELQKRN